MTNYINKSMSNYVNRNILTGVKRTKILLLFINIKKINLDSQYKKTLIIYKVNLLIFYLHTLKLFRLICIERWIILALLVFRALELRDGKNRKCILFKKDILFKRVPLV